MSPTVRKRSASVLRKNLSACGHQVKTLDAENIIISLTDNTCFPRTSWLPPSRLRLASSMALSATAWARADSSSSLPLIFLRFAADPVFSLAYYTRTSSSSVSVSWATCAVNSLVATTHFWACVSSALTTLLLFSISAVLVTQYRPRCFWKLHSFFVVFALWLLGCRTFVGRSSQGPLGHPRVALLMSWKVWELPLHT